MPANELPVSAITSDVAIFTLRERRLELLLVKRANPPFQGCWALPGGFVRVDEDLEQAARRMLAEETGVRGVYLEQLYSFGRPDRDPRGRVISVAYYALIPSDKLELHAATDAEAVAWFALEQLPELAFDHHDIVAMAHRRLAAKLDYSTIAFQFMPEKFTLSDLQEVYEIILREEMDKRNFRKWVLALERIEDTNESRRDGAHRPAKLYRVKQRNEVEFIK
jgi:8-oxo-dGTP diphosphatase